MATPRMTAQSRRLVCAGCSAQIKGKVRHQRCENCYRSRLRSRKSADPTAFQRPTWNSPGEAALASVEYAPNGCWLYTGALDRDGYGGLIGVSGHPRTVPHRAVYQHLVGPIPDGMQLDHLCHDPASCTGGTACPHRRCVNPAHLKPSTSKENTLRGAGITAINARKTHCIQGHAFTPENTRVQTRADGRTWRKCIECNRAMQRRKAQQSRPPL